MDTSELSAILDVWVQRGWIRPLDQAFVEFLRALDNASDPLLLLAAALVSHQLGRGHVYLDLAATLDEPSFALSLPPEGETGDSTTRLPSTLLASISLKKWSQIILASPLASPLVSAGKGNSPLVFVEPRLYLRRYWDYEQVVVQGIQQKLAQKVDAPVKLREKLDLLFDEPKETSKQNEINWQKIACAIAMRGTFSVITGGPGTGKTTTVVKLLALLQSAAQDNKKDLRIRLAAPTGKAAARLTESIGNAIKVLPKDFQTLRIPTEATTLHRLLGSRPGTRRFKYGVDNPIHADVVVVDEASMIDLEMMASLLCALRPESRLILLGDKDQLSSVEAGSVLGDLCHNADKSAYSPETVKWILKNTGENLKEFSTEKAEPLGQHITLLKISHRFDKNSGIGQLAKAVNEGNVEEVKRIQNSAKFQDVDFLDVKDNGAIFAKFAVEGFISSGKKQNTEDVKATYGYRYYLETLQKMRPAPDAALTEYENWARLVLKAFDEFQILCAVRKGPWGVERINQIVADSLYENNLISQTHGWYEGRPVLVTSNDYGLGLMNGDIGIALNFPEKDDKFITKIKLRIAFSQPDGSIKYVLPSRLNNVETVYAMTVHKSQGSEFSHVGLLAPETSSTLTQKMIYTGITRAKRKITIFRPMKSPSKQSDY